MTIYESRKIKGSDGLLVDLICSIAETEYAQLKQQYDLLVTPTV